MTYTPIEATVRTLLVNASGVSSLVNGRIYAGYMPQECTQPAITIRRIGGSRQYSMTGQTDVVTITLLIACFGETCESVLNVSEAVRSTLSGYSGSGILGAFCRSDPTYYYSDLGLWQVAMNWEIQTRETT